MVLLVEDDDDVRAILRAELMDMGLSVVEAATGDEAADLADAIGDIDLVVSDVAMPGRLNGFDLARRLACARPEVGVVLVSGFPTEDRDAARGLPHVTILRKPWEAHELASSVAGCFDRRARLADARLADAPIADMAPA